MFFKQTTTNKHFRYEIDYTAISSKNFLAYNGARVYSI